MAHGGYQGWGPPSNGPGPGAGPGPGPGQGGGPDPYGPPPQGPYPPQPGPYVPHPRPRPQPPVRRTAGRLGCAFWFVSPLIPLVRSARRRAEGIFNRPGHGRIEDDLVTKVQLWRAIIGFAASFGLVYVYGADDGWSGVANDGIAKLLLAPLLLMLTGPLVIAAFIYYAPAAHRGELRSRLREPLKAVGWYVGILAGTAGVLFGSALLVKQQYGTLVNGLVGLALLAALAWLLPFLAFSSAYAARYAFNTANVHAALPAALTVVLVWELMLSSLALDGGLPHGPLAAQLCAVFGGPLSVTAVALWELHRMRTRHGVRVRA